MNCPRHAIQNMYVNDHYNNRNGGKSKSELQQMYDKHCSGYFFDGTIKFGEYIKPTKYVVIIN